MIEVCTMESEVVPLASKIGYTYPELKSSFPAQEYSQCHLAVPRVEAVLPVNELGANLLEVTNTKVGGIVDELVLQDIDDLLDALSAVDVAVHEGPSEADSLDAESEELENVGSVPDTTIGVNLNLVEEIRIFAVDFEGDLEGRRRSVELTAAVVREEDGLCAVFNSFLSVLDGLDALGNDGEGGHVRERAVKLPGKEAEIDICRADTVAGCTVADTVSGRVDSEDDGLGLASLLDLGEERLGLSQIVGKVDLLEERIGGVGSLFVDGIEALGGVQRRHIQDVTGGSALDEVQLSVRVCVATTSAWGNEERC